MIFMRPEKRSAKVFLFAAAFILLITVPASMQTKKPAAKPAAKTSAKSAAEKKKDAAKVTSNNAKTVAAKKNSKATNAKNTAASKKNSKAAPANKKLTAKELAAQKKSVSSSKKQTAAQKLAEAERERKESARRAAALAEQRRREQAAREARARAIAFENGLKTQTADNIAKDVTDGEDLRIRQTAVNALGNRAGTVVVMEAKTGKIVTMVNQDWAVRHGFKPCSTIKLVTGVAGLNEGLINGDGLVTGSGSGMDLEAALARSNNPYFQRVGASLGSAKMIEYAKRLGLGAPTGINVAGENPGRLPYGNNNSRIYSHADDFEVTPLQLAVMVTAISNGGERVVPKVAKTRIDNVSSKPSVTGTIGLPDRSVQGVLPGMIGAAEYGTARRGVDAGMGVAGKTGSCIGKGSWVGLFASVAPVEEPKYAVVVITRGQGERGRIAAGIAGQIYKALDSEIDSDMNKRLAIKQIGNRPANPILPTSTTAAVGEDEDEDDEALLEATEADKNRSTVIAGSNSRPVNMPVDPNKKTVTRTSQSKPVFPTVVIPFSKDGSAPETKKSEQKSRPRVVGN